MLLCKKDEKTYLNELVCYRYIRMSQEHKLSIFPVASCELIREASGEYVNQFRYSVIACPQLVVPDLVHGVLVTERLAFTDILICERVYVCVSAYVCVS